MTLNIRIVLKLLVNVCHFTRSLVIMRMLFFSGANSFLTHQIRKMVATAALVKLSFLKQLLEACFASLAFVRIANFLEGAVSTAFHDFCGRWHRVPYLWNSLMLRCIGHFFPLQKRHFGIFCTGQVFGSENVLNSASRRFRYNAPCNSQHYMHIYSLRQRFPPNGLIFVRRLIRLVLHSQKYKSKHSWLFEGPTSP